MLLDSHVVLWTLEAPERLGPDAVRALANPATRRVVSTATLWELAIKSASGRLQVQADLPELLRCRAHEFLDVTAAHAWSVRQLPLVHGDPFDRLLVAQAQVEDLPLITHDRQLERYNIRVIRA